MASEYKAVPVDAARVIADRFDKDMVVILAWNRAMNLMHTTTYGRRAQEKVFAAKLGDIVTAAAGCDLAAKASFRRFSGKNRRRTHR